MKVFIVPNYARRDAVDGGRELEDWLIAEGHDAAWAPDKHLVPDSAEEVARQAEAIAGFDLVVSLGGDGTLLRAARFVGYSGIPMLGISYGHLGFLTTDGPGRLVETVGDALAGRLHRSHRATLDIETTFEHPDGTTSTLRSFALNDFAVSRGEAGDMVEFEVLVSGNHIDYIRGDGFVVSTATGSTGYALAAGGPIVTPEFTGMVCVPIAPHTILARAFLTSPDDEVEVVMSASRPAMRHFFADGQNVRRDGEDGVPVRAVMRRGPGDIVLLDHSAQSFYRSVSRVFYGRVGK